MPFFKFSAKQFWTTIFLFTIILFFILPVPVLMIISGSAPLSASDIEDLRAGFASDWPVVIRYFTVIAMSAFAVVLSCSRFKYLKNKVSVDFYHSLPIKRGRLFLTQLAISALSLVIPYLFNVLFTLTVFASNGLVTGTLILNILAVTVDTFVYAIFFYALSTLIGMVSGMTSVQLTLTWVAVFIVPATYALTVGFLSLFSEHMWVDFYLHADVFEKMTPAFRFVINPDVLSIWEILGLLLISAAMLVGAYAIYMYRKSERSGTPIVFTPLGEVIKYIIVFVGTLCGGLLFYGIMGDLFWMVFGMICGAVLTFMLTNTILNKTAKAMFKGWKGLCIYGGVAAIAFIILSTNAFGINDHIPAPALTSKVSVNFDNDGGTMVFRDKEVIEALHYIYKNGQTFDEAFSYSYSGSIDIIDRYEYDKVFVTDYTAVRMVFYPKFGLPYAKYIPIYNKADFVEQFKTILNSEEFAEQYASELEPSPDSGRIYVDLPNLIFHDDKMYNYTSGRRSHRFDEDPTFEEVAKTCGVHIMLEEMENIDFDFFQQPAVGYVDIYSDNTDIMLPIFTSMTKTAAFHDANGYNYSPDKLCEALAENASNFRILGYDENGTEKVMKISDREQMLEILRASTNPIGNHSYTSPFTLKDTRFKISYDILISDHAELTYYYDENGVEHAVVEYKDSTESYTDTYTATFLLGKVPEFVIEYFSE